MMAMKANENGTISFTYDNESYGTAIATKTCDSIYTPAYTMESLKSTVEKLTREPEVRKEQRSKLDISDNGVYALYYVDGFLDDRKFIIPAIEAVEVFASQTVKVTFKNGHTQTSTAHNGDDFSLENGVLYCIVKEMIGREGTSIINKLISYATKVHFDGVKKQMDDLKAEKETKKIKAKKDKKFQKYIEKKRAKERENRIQEMAEAIVRAKEIEKNV